MKPRFDTAGKIPLCPLCLHPTLLSKRGTVDRKSKQIYEETHSDNRKGEAEDEMDECRGEVYK